MINLRSFNLTLLESEFLLPIHIFNSSLVGSISHEKYIKEGKITDS